MIDSTVILAKLAAFGILSAGVACSSEPEFRCTAEHTTGYATPQLGDPVCSAAALQAALSSSELIPSQVDIDRYYERLQRAASAEQLLRTWYYPVGARRMLGATILTQNPQIIAAWDGIAAEPARPTGDPTFDELMSTLGATVHRGYRILDSDTFGYSFYARRVFQAELLDQRLRPTSSWLEESIPDSAVGSHWRWADATGRDIDSATAEIHTTVGWGDCIAGCAFHHDFLTIVPPEGEATVYDLGGDPLPPDWELSPNTTSPP